MTQQFEFQVDFIQFEKSVFALQNPLQIIESVKYRQGSPRQSAFSFSPESYLKLVKSIAKRIRWE